MATDRSKGDGLNEEVLSRLNILEMVGKTVKLKATTRSDEHKGCCPFHEDSSPSFFVNSTKGVFNCKGCGEAGNAVAFYAKQNGIEYGPALRELADMLGINKKDPKQKTALDRAQSYYTWGLEQHAPAMDYLRSRELTKETIERFGLGYSRGNLQRVLESDNLLNDGFSAGILMKGENERVFELMSKRIVIPVHDEHGTLVAFAGRHLEDGYGPKYLNTLESEKFKKGETLYGLHLAKRAMREAGYAVMVEGYMDVIGLHQAGIQNAIASMGTAVTRSAFSKIWSNTNRLVIAFDPDAAGDKGAFAAIINAAKHMKDGCSIGVISLPSGMDPDNYVASHGADEFRVLCDNATNLSEFVSSMVAKKHNFNSAEGRATFLAEIRGFADLFQAAPMLAAQMIEDAKNMAAIHAMQLAAETTRFNMTPEEVERVIEIAKARSRPAIGGRRVSVG